MFKGKINLKGKIRWKWICTERVKEWQGMSEICLRLCVWEREGANEGMWKRENVCLYEFVCEILFERMWEYG